MGKRAPRARQNSSGTSAGINRDFSVLALRASRSFGRSLTQIEASGIDVMLVLDVSGSMLTKDFTIGGQEPRRRCSS